MFSPSQEERCVPNKEPVKYGELVVLGSRIAVEDGEAKRVGLAGDDIWQASGWGMENLEGQLERRETSEVSTGGGPEREAE
uniref:Uncharacterized protein n=1 Tax=Sphaerodactylus townsendi TaxID=933632 RepID=A0ACB8G6B6_9SAUR